MRLRCDVLSYLNWRDHYIRRMAVRAHQRDHELGDTLTMLRSRVGYNKFHQAASLLYLPSRVNLFSSTSWSEAARSPSLPLPPWLAVPKYGSCASSALGARLAALGADTPKGRSRATGRNDIAS